MAVSSELDSGIQSSKPVSRENAPRRGRMKLRPQVRLGAIVALAIAAGFVAWLVVRDHGSTTAPSGPNPTVAGSRGSAGPGLGPVGMSRAALVKLQRSVHHPIYWAGPKPGYTYELTQRRDGTIYVRYLPQGVRVGDPRGAFLIVVTYPYP